MNLGCAVGAALVFVAVGFLVIVLVVMKYVGGAICACGVVAVAVAVGAGANAAGVGGADVGSFYVCWF